MRPSFLGIGAQRAGTTWLDALLRSHPGLWLPGRRKEIHYFDRHHDRGPAWYDAFFRDAPPGRLTGEVTPRYLFDPRVPARIASELPEVALVAILRDPVDRAYSQYGLTVRDEDYGGSFEDFLAERPDALARGRYHTQLARYLERFPRERIAVLVFEQAIRRPRAAMDALGGLLGVDPTGFEAPSRAERMNAGGLVRHGRGYAAARRLGEWLRRMDWDAPVNAAKRLGVARLFGPRTPLPPMRPETRARLWRELEPDARELERRFGLDLSAWGPEASAARGPERP